VVGGTVVLSGLGDCGVLEAAVDMRRGRRNVVVLRHKRCVFIMVVAVRY
jgi:hypothetical protein